MIFPCMELFFLIFQVFHDFQSSWEHCPLGVSDIQRVNEQKQDLSQSMTNAPKGMGLACYTLWKVNFFEKMLETLTFEI